MYKLWFLALLLVTGALRTTGRLAVMGVDGRVSVVSPGETRIAAPPSRRALFVAWDPSGRRLVVVEEVELRSLHPFRLIVRETDRKAAKPRLLKPAPSQSFYMWRQILGVSWPREDFIAVEGEISPGTIAMVKVNTRSGALDTDIDPGKGFFWAPDGATYAAIGWTPYLGPEPDTGDRVVVDGKKIYEGPKGNEIPGPLLWSPDGGRLAFVEQKGDRRDLLVVPATPGGEPHRFALTGSPALLAWSDDGRALLLRNGQEDVRFDAATGAFERLDSHDLASQGFARFAIAADNAVRAAQMGGRASSWWAPPGAAESPKGKTP